MDFPNKTNGPIRLEISQYLNDKSQVASEKVNLDFLKGIDFG